METTTWSPVTCEFTATSKDGRTFSHRLRGIAEAMALQSKRIACRECDRTAHDVRIGIPAPGGGCSRCEDC